MTVATSFATSAAQLPSSASHVVFVLYLSFGVIVSHNFPASSVSGVVKNMQSSEQVSPTFRLRLPWP